MLQCAGAICYHSLQSLVQYIICVMLSTINILNWHMWGPWARVSIFITVVKHYYAVTVSVDLLNMNSVERLMAQLPKQTMESHHFSLQCNKQADSVPNTVHVYLKCSYGGYNFFFRYLNFIFLGFLASRTELLICSNLCVTQLPNISWLFFSILLCRRLDFIFFFWLSCTSFWVFLLQGPGQTGPWQWSHWASVGPDILWLWWGQWWSLGGSTWWPLQSAR